MNQDIDYIYTKSVFDRLEKVIIKNTSLPGYFVVDGYDYWQFYRQRVFEDIKEFSRTQTLLPETPQSLVGFLKDSVLHVSMLLMGLFTYGIALVFRKRILIYGIDRVNSKHGSDFRMASVYDFLEQNHISYSELLHTIPGKHVLQNLLVRKRTALYLETCDWLYGMCIRLRVIKPYPVFDPQAMQIPTCAPHERVFIQKTIARYVYQIGVSRFKVALLAFLFRYAPFTTLYAIDDARYYHEILLAARLGGLKSYAFQHGHFTKYHVGWLRNGTQCGITIHPDELLVWSGYWKDELLRLGSATPENAIKVGGGKVLPIMHSNEHKVLSELITVLIPYETSCPKKEVASYIEDMLHSKRIRIIFKLRPDLEESVQLSEYGLDGIQDSHFMTTKDVSKYINEVDMVAGVYSTFLYDMIAIGKRVVMLETSSDYGEGMCIHDLADVLKKNADIYKTLKGIQDIPQESIEKRREKLVDPKMSLMDTLQIIAKERNVIKK